MNAAIQLAATILVERGYEVEKKVDGLIARQLLHYSYPHSCPVCGEPYTFGEMVSATPYGSMGGHYVDGGLRSYTVYSCNKCEWVGSDEDMKARSHDKAWPVYKSLDYTLDDCVKLVEKTKVFAYGSSGDRLRAYGKAALEGLQVEVSAAQAGRNNVLNRAAFRAGTISAACGLSEEEATRVLLKAATDAGLPEAEAIATIVSGFKAGLAKPEVL